MHLLTLLRTRLAQVLGVALSLLAVYTAGFGAFEDLFQRAGGIGLGALILLLNAPKAEESDSRFAPLLAVLDLLLVIASSTALVWFFIVSEALETGLYDLTHTDIAIGSAGIVALLELSRRIMGLPLFLIGILSLIYCLFGNSLPWIFTHAGYSAEETLRTMWYSFDGVFGLPTAVVVNMIAVFVVFGVVLEGTGAGAVLLKIAFSLTGGLRGGPAHAAIVSSGLFGTISGSVVGNVVGTGVFTMPMISKRGFPNRFAGAVEAAASSGGQFMPPVMGAVAFIMAELVGASYLTICAAALMPALFYYGALFCAVSVEAARIDIKPIPKSERKKISRDDWIKSLGFVIPVVIILAVLIAGRSPAVAGFWAILSALVLGFILNEKLRKSPLQLLQTLANAGRTTAMILVAVGVIGVVIGTMNLTGLGLRFSTLILSFANDSLLISLLLMMGGSLVLGMGLPTVPAYLIIVLVMGPAIQQLGVDVITVHLFVMYFGVLSSITPPVAIAAYAAAPICNAQPLRVAVTAVRIALIGFVIPFVVVYNPALTLVIDFTWADFSWICLRLSLAIWLLTTALGGFCGSPLGLVSRGLRLAAATTALFPITEVAIGGTIIGFALVAQHRYRQSRSTHPNTPHNPAKKTLVEEE